MPLNLVYYDIYLFYRYDKVYIAPNLFLSWLYVIILSALSFYIVPLDAVAASAVVLSYFS